METSNKDSALELAIHTLEQYITTHRMRRTPERIAILKQICHLSRSFTAEQIFETMDTKYHVSLATVYSTLQLFTRCNLVARHEIEGQPARYQRLFGNGTRRYIHLICIHCGKVTEHQDNYLSNLVEGRSFKSFTPLYPSFFVYGLCSKCARQQKKLQQTNTTHKKH